MEQQPMRIETKVGLFIAIGLIAVAVSILLLGSNKAIFNKYAHYQADFTDVQGLFQGSVVSLTGLTIGNVDNIILVPGSSKIRVDIKIDAQFAPRINVGTVAEVRTSGALGDKYIYITPGPLGGAELPVGSALEPVENDYMKLLTSRDDGLARVIDLIKEMQTLVASINQNGQTAVLMHNMTEASGQLKVSLMQLNGLISDLRGGGTAEDNKLKTSIASLSSILVKIDQGKGTLGQLINDPSVHQSLKAFLGSSHENKYMKDMIRETLQHSETKAP